MRFFPRSLLAVFFVFGVLAGQVACRPFPASKRENNLNRNQVLDTSRNSFGMGSVECCSVTLVPTKFNNGSSGVQIGHSCAIIMADTCPSSTQSATASPSMSVSPTTAVSSVTAETTATPSSGVTSMPEPTTTASSSSLSSSLTSDTPSSSTVLSFFPPSSTTTPTSSTPTPSQTSLDSSAIATTKQSTALPKVIGAFAGISVACLIAAGFIGYKKHKKLQAKVDGTKISWPTFR